MKNGSTEQALRSERERWEAGTKALAQLVADLEEDRCNCGATHLSHGEPHEVWCLAADHGDDFSDLATNALVPPLTADHGWRCECGICDQTRLDEWSDR